VHQVAYARALERLTGADLMKLFSSARIPTSKIPECQPHIKRGEHLELYRVSPDSYREIGAVFSGPHPATGEDLHVADEVWPEAAPPFDPPHSRPCSLPVPEEIAQIAAQLRQSAGSARAAHLETAPVGQRSPWERRSAACRCTADSGRR
jgi:hypothetical protein